MFSPRKTLAGEMRALTRDVRKTKIKEIIKKAAASGLTECSIIETEQDKATVINWLKGAGFEVSDAQKEHDTRFKITVRWTLPMDWAAEEVS